MKKAKIKRKSYDYGGNIDLSQVNNDHDYIDNPDTLFAQNQINWAKAKAEVAKNPFYQAGKMLGKTMKGVGTKIITSAIPGQIDDTLIPMGLQGLDMYNQSQGLNQFAFGGEVPVEVEGDEAFELPNGQVGMFQGPTHEQGGIDANLPEGTDIYSDRISMDGKTMAERKLIRENKIKRLEKKLKKNPSDTMLKNTLGRIQYINNVEEQQDKAIQESVKNIKGNNNQNREEFGNGGTTNLNIPDWILNLENTAVSPNFDGSIEKGMFNKGKFIKPDPLSFVPQKWDSTKGNYIPDLDKAIEGQDEIQLEPESENFANSVVNPNAHKVSTEPGVGYKLKQDLKSAFSQPDMGGINANDVIGMAGNFFQAYAPYIETLNNRASDSPNINPFKNTGKESVDTIESGRGYVKQLRNQALSDLELSRTGAIKRNRNSARSINTQRALDLTTDQAVNRQQAEIYDKSVAQMLAINNQSADAKFKRDVYYGQGEQMRDENNRKDKDNYSKQLSRNLRDIGEMVTTQGDTLGRIKSRKANLKLTSEENPNFYSDANGNIHSKITGKLATAEERKQYANELKVAKTNSTKNGFSKKQIEALKSHGLDDSDILKIITGEE